MSQSAAISQAEIFWLEDGTPYSKRFKDVYFSSLDGFAETVYVFLKHNQFPQRFRDNHSLNIGETGFGTGLNFLVTAFHWIQQKDSRPDNNKLGFISIEKYPLSKQQLLHCFQLFIHRWPCLKPVCKLLADNYPEQLHFDNLMPENISLEFPYNITLHLLLGDVSKQLKKLSERHQYKIDAWYLDGFAPTKNQSMWTPELYNYIAKLSSYGTTLSTYTAAGEVRRGLIQAGFKMNKTRGFAHKREMLYGMM